MKPNCLSLLSLLFVLSIGCKSPGEKQTDKKQEDTLAVSIPVKEFIFGDDHAFKQCHASTVVHLNNGEFLAAWFGGTIEKNDDVGIWSSIRTGGKWNKPSEVAKIRNDAHWNPVLFQSPAGKIFLFLKLEKKSKNGKHGYRLLMIMDEHGVQLLN